MTRRSLKAEMSAALATLALPLGQELVVDLFAGGGGASVGIAGGYREPDVAVNHSVAAIAAHEANHAGTIHFRCDVWEVDPVAATGGRPVGLLWASPDCRHFSKAKGGKPVSDSVRSLADVVIKWARETRPRVLMLENVEEFTTWGPLLPDGRPCPVSRGLTFRRWVRDLEAEGYVVEYRELRACWYGTPTLRKRLFVIARRDGQPIVWPAPTHAAPDDPRVQRGELQQYRTAADCIAWSTPVCSIFATPAEAKAWAAEHGQKSPQRPLKANTLRRVAKGIVRYVIDSPRPFIVPLRGTSAAHTSTHSVDDPAATVSAGGQHHALAIPFVAPNMSNNVPRGAGEPVPTVTGGGRNMLVMPVLTECANGTTQRVFPADEPLRTQCAQVKGGHFALAAPTLMHVNHQGERAGQPVDVPLNTVTGAPRGEQAVAVPYLVPRYGERPGQEPRTADAAAPAPTIVPTGNGGSLAVANLVAMGQNAIGSAPDEPAQTVLAGAPRFGLSVATIAKFRGDSAGHAADEPLPTITAGGQMARPAGAAHALGVVTACLEQANGCHESPGHRPDKPMSTVTGTGSQQRLVTAHLIQYYSTGGQHAPADEPARTIPTKGRVAVVEAVQLRTDVLTPLQWRTARAAAALLRQYFPERFPVAAGEEPEIVMIGDYILVDIGLRMLKPRELARAQGFSDRYILNPFISVESRGRVVRRRLTATEQVKLIGNSVCPQVAEALVRANLATLIQLYSRERAAA